MPQTIPSRFRSRASRSGRASLGKAGFTLVELIVAAVILMIVASGTAQLFIRTNVQLRDSRTRNTQQGQIDQDLATVLQMNDRYSCSSLPTSGATSSNCAVAGGNPGESGYTPPPVATASFTGSGYERFLTLCNGGTLNAALLTAINAVGAPASVTRTTTNLSTGANLLTHRYSVTWTDANGNLLRREVLTPTVAGWCP